MNVFNIIALFGGLALFLFGIQLMGDGLKKVAGGKLQGVLYKMTNSRFKGILLGTGVTALIQSSSAASIMAIGFVNSGLMQFRQAISIILGAIIGSSFTGWIVTLSSISASSGWLQLLSTAFITNALAIVGICLAKFSKKPVKNQIGNILLGFAILMFGISAMTSAISPLQESEAFLSILTEFSNPILGILAGMIFTAVIQSSSASVGILQTLSMAGMLTFSSCYPVLLGIAIGGALPVLISAWGASVNARRTAVVHLIADIFAAVFCGGIFYLLNAILNFGFMDMAMTPVSVAALNTAFRIVTVVVLTPFIGLLEKITCRIIPEKGDSEMAAAQGNWELLESRFINMPALAIEQSRIVIRSMADLVKENFTRGVALLDNYDEHEFAEVEDIEDLVDQYEDRLGTYLVKVSSSEMNTEQNEDLYQFLHAVTDLERISDLSTNIAENAKEIHDDKLQISAEAKDEIATLMAATDEVTTLALNIIKGTDSEAVYMVEPLEELIDNFCDKFKHNHIDRVQKGKCKWENGFVFSELLTNFERISDHCSNLAVARIELNHESFDTHDYIASITKGKNEKFDTYYAMYKEKYDHPGYMEE